MPNLFTAHKKRFLRSNATALAATVVDFSTLYVLTHFAGVYYVLSTAIGAAFGAVTNFTLNRFWAFESRETKALSQGFRYFIVSLGSLGLNTVFVYLLTEHLHTHYMVSKVISALSVGWFWNYPLHHYFVFPAKKV